MGSIAAIDAFLVLADKLFGLKIVQALFQVFMRDGGLTDEQKAQLEANHADYLARIAVREAQQ